MELSTQHSAPSTQPQPARRVAYIRSADDPRLWACWCVKTERGHEFHFVRQRRLAKPFWLDDARMIVEIENRQRLTGKLEIVPLTPGENTGGEAKGHP